MVDRLEELAKDTVVEIAEILNNKIEITVSREDFYEALDEMKELLVEKFEEVYNG